MQAWRSLPAGEQDSLWTEVEARYKFRAGVESRDWPGIDEPSDSVTFSINSSSPQSLGAFKTTLALIARKGFSEAAPTRKGLVALEWQHGGYWYHPEAESPADLPDRNGRPSIFPDGEYSFFLSQDFEHGLFSHPWGQTICVFGQQLVELLTPEFSQILPLVRRGGQPSYPS
jgi:hypothetical protein